MYLEVSAGLDGLSLPGPLDPGLGVAGEWDLDDPVLALVEEGRVTEPRGHVQPCWSLDLELSLK